MPHYFSYMYAMNDVKGLYKTSERSSTPCHDSSGYHLFYNILSYHDISESSPKNYGNIKINLTIRNN